MNDGITFLLFVYIRSYFFLLSSVFGDGSKREGDDRR